MLVRLESAYSSTNGNMEATIFYNGCLTCADLGSGRKGKPLANKLVVVYTSNMDTCLLVMLA